LDERQGVLLTMSVTAQMFDAKGKLVDKPAAKA
jgi:hypothetical protein